MTKELVRMREEYIRNIFLFERFLISFSLPPEVFFLNVLQIVKLTETDLSYDINSSHLTTKRDRENK